MYPSSPHTQEYEQGDILVEIEPVQYELRNIKLNKLRTVIKKNTTILGKTESIERKNLEVQNFRLTFS